MNAAHDNPTAYFNTRHGRLAVFANSRHEFYLRNPISADGNREPFVINNVDYHFDMSVVAPDAPAAVRAKGRARTKCGWLVKERNLRRASGGEATWKAYDAADFVLDAWAAWVTPELRAAGAANDDAEKLAAARDRLAKAELELIAAKAALSALTIAVG